MKKSVIRAGNRVALYARFSSDNQRSESIDAQVRAMTAYCRQHHYIVVSTYIDEAKSATTDRRPDFQRMIEDSKKGIFDIVLVHKLDRFARNRYDSAVYKRELKKNGVSVYSVLENLDDSPESIMMESVLEGMAEYYSQNLGREVMKGMKETALQCKHTGGKPPLGYDLDEETKRLVINEEEAQAVRLIYEMYANGQGYTAIVYELNSRGWQTKKKQEFRKNSLHDILVNPKYGGTYTFNKKAAKNGHGTRNNHDDKNSSEIISIPGGCPQIVDTDTFNRVQQRMKSGCTGKRAASKYTYLLSGKVFCGECGRRMCGCTRPSGHGDKISGLYSTYRCILPKHSCGNREINRDYLDAYVIQLLEQMIFRPTAMRALVKKIQKAQPQSQQLQQQRTQELQAKLSEVELALERVTDAVAKGLLSDALVKRLDELEQQKADITSELTVLQLPTSAAAIEIDPTVIPAQYKELKQAPASPAYKAMLYRFVDRIEVGQYTVSITIKTGLGVYDFLDTTLTVRRQEIYEKGKAAKSAET